MERLIRLYNSKYFNIILLISFFCLPFIMYWSLFTSNMVPVSGDGVQFFSGKVFFHNCLIQGEFPLWNKYLSNGVPYAPDLSNAALYPISIVMAFLPLKIFIYAFYAIHLAIGAYFVYLYIKEIGCGKVAALCTALIYELSIHLGGYRKEHIGIIATIIWLPVILYFIERYIKTKSIKFLMFSSIAMAFQFMSSFIQTTAYTDITVFIYIICRIIQEKIDLKTAIKEVAAWIFLYIGLTLIQLLPTIQLLNYYIKAGATEPSLEYFQSYSIHFLKLIMMIFPKIFGNLYQAFGVSFSSEFDIEIFLGVFVFMLILFGILRHFKDQKIKLAFGFMVGSFVYAANAHIPILNKIIYQIPILGGFRVPSRALFIFIFFGLVIFAITLSKLKQKIEIKKLLKFNLAILAITVGILCTAGITLLIMTTVNESTSQEIQKYYVYIKTALLPSIIIILISIIILFIVDKTNNKLTVKGSQRTYAFLAISILIITIFETSQFSMVYWQSSLDEFSAKDKVVDKMKNDIGYSKAWVAFPGIDGGYKSVFSQNSNMAKGVPTLNSYISFNNPRFYKLFSYGENAPYNMSGLLTGSVKAADNINLDNDLLSMLDTKFIIDPFNLIKEDGSITRLSNEGELLYKKDKITIPNTNGELFVFAADVKLKANAYYKITFNLNSSGEQELFYVDFYGGPTYDRSEQQKGFVVNQCEQKKYCCYINSGDIPDEKSTQIRIITKPTSEMIVSNFTLIEMEATKTPNVYKAYNIEGKNRIFENTLAKGIMYTPKNIQSINDVNDIYENGLSYDFVTTDYIEHYKNVNISNVSTTIVIEDFKNNSLRANVESDGATFVNFSQNYYPGWKAYVDGKETPIYLVNGLIQGIEVPEGKHIIEFKFNSPVMILGGILTLLSLVIIIWIIKKSKG